MINLKRYVVLAFVVLVLHYLIPYIILYEPRGLTLTAYWTILSLFWVVITIYFIRRW